MSQSPSTTRPHVEGAATAGEQPAKDIKFLARGGSLALVGVVCSGALQLVLIAAVTRGLGAAAAGVFVEALALFMILSRVGELGATTGLVRTIPRFRALGRTVDLRPTLLVAGAPVVLGGLILGAGMYASASQLAIVFFDSSHEAEAAELIRLLSPLVPLASFGTVALGGTRGFGKMVPYVAVQNIALPAVRLGLVVAAVAAGLGSVAAGLAWGLPAAVAAAVSMTWLVVLLRRAERGAKRSAGAPTRLGRLAAEFWSFSAPRGMAGILGIAVTWMGILLVGALGTTSDAAIYAAASRLAIVGAYALQAVGMAIAPRVSALLAQGEAARVEALYRMATWWLMALVWPLYLGMAAFSPFVMELFGPEFVAGQTALVVLCLAMLVNLATGNVTTVLLMGGKSSWNLFNAALSLALNVGLNLLLTPRFGVNGAAIAWAASLIFVNVAPVVQVRLFLGLRPPLGAGFVVVALAVAICYGGLGLAVRHGLGMSPATLAIFAVSGTGLYAAALWRFRELLHIPELLGSLRLRARRRPPTASPGSSVVAPAVEGS